MLLSVESLLAPMELQTINFGDTGALSASEISCTFALTLPFLVRMVLKASLKLFCLPCPLPPELTGVHVEPRNPLSLRDCHLSTAGAPLAYALPLIGLVEYFDCSSRDSMWSGNFSIDVRRGGFESPGILKFETRVTDDARVE